MKKATFARDTFSSAQPSCPPRLVVLAVDLSKNPCHGQVMSARVPWPGFLSAIQQLVKTLDREPIVLVLINQHMDEVVCEADLLQRRPQRHGLLNLLPGLGSQALREAY